MAVVCTLFEPGHSNNAIPFHTHAHTYSTAGVTPHVSADDAEDADTPGWVENEEREFGEMMDKNKDGKLDRDEIRQWIAPSEEEFTGEEADHLIRQGDKDKVCQPCVSVCVCV